MSWRDAARPIIARVLAETAGQDEATIRKALKAAYPFGERRYHPYKMWLDEIKRQRGLYVSRKESKDQRKLREWEQLYGKS